MIEPLRISVDVACGPEHAFATWTERFGSWWPRVHTTSGDPGATVFLEAGVGGRIYEQISFVPLDDGTTRVDIVPTGWERLGTQGQAWRDANAGGWGGLLPHFLTACKERTS